MDTSVRARWPGPWAPSILLVSLNRRREQWVFDPIPGCLLRDRSLAALAFLLGK